MANAAVLNMRLFNHFGMFNKPLRSLYARVVILTSAHGFSPLQPFATWSGSASTAVTRSLSNL